MSVIGIDFGNESCFIAAAVSGGIETLANDYSLRATPACVAFAGKKRVLGVAAKNQQVTNMKNTVSNFKRLLGRKFNDPAIQDELKALPYRVEALPNGGIGIRVSYMEQEHVFTPEQVTAMLFTKLKETCETALKKPMKDCVITVPSFFTSAERSALIDAAQIAGLNILHLLNETTAVALLYGFYKTDLPPPEEKPTNVVFVDFGQSQLQVAICAYNRGKLRMVSSAWDQIGGRNIDAIMAEVFAEQFIKKYRVNAHQNPRAYLRLMSEVEKLKKQMSANSTKLPLNIDCFIDEIDVTSNMSRTEMEELCADIFKRVELTCRKCLQDSGLSADDIAAVEVVGGSTRIPAVKAIIEQVFAKPINTTLNQDEAVSRGAALQCAILSPAVRVHDFGITDIQNFAVRIAWDLESNNRSEMEVFKSHHEFPFSRMITLQRREPLSLQLFYADPDLRSDSFIGRWYVKNIKPTATGEAQEVKIKVRINSNGVIQLTSANIVDKKPKEEAPNDNGNTDTNNMEVAQEGDDGKKGKKKKSADLVELPFDSQLPGNTEVDLQKFKDEESRMIGNDEKEKERVDARNALEEYVYDMREKLSEEGSLSTYIEGNHRQNICQQLNDLENWLYEEGEDCENDIYRSKLSDLHKQTDPIKARSFEYENQMNAFTELGHAVQMARKSINEFRTNTAKYEHITEVEILNVTEATDRAQRWLEENTGRVANTSKTLDPPVRISDIRNELNTLTVCVNSVLNRPKPKAPTPPASNNGTSGNGEQTEAGQSDAKNAEQGQEDKMDVE
ncbi:heat shock 70 kDa protein 4 isoform X2 [Contarinia nasturtii]|uniref:heat shock 70 kDa protein 4 isoform X2 n=1 Tax=Contarinia nasturtii TaxID=265458 RepID=UPI0012D3D385|nr:heat shock 70 kDa protein 4 isoform X2 [Contarinia nasturtii]